MTTENKPFGSGKAMLLLALTLTVVGAIAYFSGAPKPTRAAGGGPLDGYTLYGVNPTTAALVKYRFADNTLSPIGSVSAASSGTMTGIQATSSFPGFSNVFGFWNDPSDQLTKLIYISKTDALASIIGSPLGPEKITGSAAIHVAGTTNYQMYAVQAANTVPFVINTTSGTATGQVVASEPFAARVTVLGAAITSGGAYDMPVGIKVTVGTTTLEPFGDADLALPGNVNDTNNPRAFILPTTYTAGTPISVWARSWQKTDPALSGSDNSHWAAHISKSSDAVTNNVMTLRDGDSVPTIPGFQDQASIEVFIHDFIDPATHKVSLGPNQVIYLFELGSAVTVNPYTSPASLTASQDFQDAVVLVTFADDPSDLASGNVTTGVIDGEFNINPSHNPNASFELTKPDGSLITLNNLLQATAADLTADGTYYAGSATSIVFKPKGNGKQNALTVDGSPYDINNRKTYTASASALTVRVYNDQLNGSGAPMGHWRLEVTTAASGNVENGSPTDDPSSSNQLVAINHQDGTYTPLMTISQPYPGLASTDGQNFFAATGGKIYLLDTVNQTETLLHDHGASASFTGLEFAGSTLYAFNNTDHTLVPIDTTTGAATGSPISVTTGDLGTIFFDAASTATPVSYD